MAVDRPHPGSVGTAAARRRQAGRFAAISLLATDLRMVFIILNQGRYRTLERYLGLSREEANVATAIIVLLLADSAYEQAARMRRMVRPPAPADMVLGAAAVRESIYGVAGTSSWEMPLAGSLVTIAVAVRLGSPVVRRSARAIQASYGHLREALDRQYGRVRELAPGRTSAGDRLAGESASPRPADLAIDQP